MKIVGQLLQIEADQRDRSLNFTCAYSIRSVAWSVQLPSLTGRGIQTQYSWTLIQPGFQSYRVDNAFT